MYNGNLIEDKTFELAKTVVGVYRRLSGEKKEFVLSKQLLRAGTSVGANVAEAQRAQSKADFISKMSIAQKEANEAKYWIRLLYDTDYLDDSSFDSLILQIDEILRLLGAICKTSVANR